VKLIIDVLMGLTRMDVNSDRFYIDW